MNLKHMTDEELIKLNEELNNILEERREGRRKIAIANFRKAFEELEECVYRIMASDCNYSIIIHDFDQFYFGD